MFAAADMSAADTIISVWHAKYVDGFWRPSTAINLADTDGNPATDPDPSWVPLRPDPAYPEYPSGYNGFAAAVTRALENLFHTRRLQLTVTSTAVPGVQRHYDSGGALRRDVVDGRMWLGVHFRFADTAARDMGDPARRLDPRPLLPATPRPRPGGIVVAACVTDRWSSGGAGVSAGGSRAGRPAAACS
jgi:hypothetical protein